MWYIKIEPGLLKGSATLLVLSLLENDAKYGYEMIRELERRSEEAFALKEGTLYPILHKLENDGMVQSYEKESTAGKKRKYYMLTKDGKRLLVDKKEEWFTFAKQVNKVIGGESYFLT